MPTLTTHLVLREHAHDAADGRADEDAGARRIDALDTRVRPGFARRSDGENDVALEPARVLGPTTDSGSNPFTSDAIRTG